MNKVKLDVLKPWITKKISELLKMEDDVVVEFVFNQLEEKVSARGGSLCIFCRLCGILYPMFERRPLSITVGALIAVSSG
jgi:hypothetical protein